MKIVCKQCGKICENAGLGLCKKHYNQLKSLGKFTDSCQRTYYDPNEYVIHGDFTEVFTYNNKYNIAYKFIIDTEDLPLIIKNKWNYTRPKQTKDGYLIYMINKKIGLFHRYIMGNPRGTVDHINRNTLDNRKSNLRCASYSEQNLNRVYKSTRFDIKGIDIHKDTKRAKRYMARFNINKKAYRSPWYRTYEEAVYCRYLLQQLSPISVLNGNMEKYFNALDENRKKEILSWFKNRFKNRV